LIGTYLGFLRWLSDCSSLLVSNALLLALALRISICGWMVSPFVQFLDGTICGMRSVSEAKF
jgi:hypothetical protein